MVDERDPYDPDRPTDADPASELPHSGDAGAAGGSAAPGGPYIAVTRERNGPAWEWRKQLGFWKALFTTIKEVLLNPGETFNLARREGDFVGPLLFFLILSVGCQLLGFLIASPFQIGIGSIFQQWEQSNPGLSEFEQYFMTQLSWPLQVLTVLLIGPILATVSAFIASGIIHLILMLLNGARFPYETTFRAFAYTGGSAALFQLVPFCGSVIAPVVQIVILVIALARMHEITTGKALAAVLLPSILALFCCCCGTLALFMTFTGLSRVPM